MAKHVSDIHLPSNASIAAGVNGSEALTAKPTEAHVEAINHLFTELELAYHNQFHKAFPDHQSLSKPEGTPTKVLEPRDADQNSL